MESTSKNQGYENGAIRTSYPEIKEIGKNLQSLKDNVGELAHHVKDEGLNDVTEAAKQEYKNLLVFGKRLERKIRQQPAQSLAIAFAGGVLASYLLGRR